MTQKAGRSLWWVAGLSLSLLLVAGLVTWAVLDDDPYVAPEPDQVARTAAPALATSALRALEQAVRAGDTAAAAALAAPGDQEARTALSALASNAEEARVEDFSLRYVTELSGVDREGSWAASVDVTWAFRGFDDGPSRSDVRFQFVQVDGEVRVAGVGGGDRRTPVWMSGPLEVRRTPTTLVLVAGDAALADNYAERARAAVPAVRRVLPEWRARLVVEVPASVDALHAALVGDPGRLDNIAATTVAAGTVSVDAPIHVFVNPQVFGDQKARGAQIVMTHEAVHIATEAAAASPVPLWLLEGFADYVALRDTDLPDSVTARRVIRQVRQDGPPARLPGQDEFDTTAQHLGAAYEAAWLACRLLAERGGERALVRLYERVAAEVPLGRALAGSFGLTQRQLTTEWQDLLTDLAA